MSMNIIKTLIKAEKKIFFFSLTYSQVPASFSTFNAFIQFIFIIYGIIAYKTKGRNSNSSEKKIFNRYEEVRKMGKFWGMGNNYFQFQYFMLLTCKLPQWLNAANVFNNKFFDRSIDYRLRDMRMNIE